VPAPPTKPSFSLEPNERETVPAWTFERESKSGHPTISLFALASNERQTATAPQTKFFALELNEQFFALELNERESVPVPHTKPSFVLEPNEHESVPAPPHSLSLCTRHPLSPSCPHL